MSDKSEKQTVLGPECRISGEMSLDGDAVVMGQFHGTLRVGGMLEVAESAFVSGTIITGALRLGGRAEADVVAEHGAELLAGCELTGRLYTNRLSVVDGAAFEGEVVVGPKAMAAAEPLLQDGSHTTSGNGNGNGNGNGAHRRNEESLIRRRARAAEASAD